MDSSYIYIYIHSTATLRGLSNSLGYFSHVKYFTIDIDIDINIKIASGKYSP